MTKRLASLHTSTTGGNRREAIDGELDFYQTDKYDNLSRVIKTERYDTDLNGNLVSRNKTKYDARGRVWRRTRFEVNSSTGAVGNLLKDNTWYDPAGNVIKQLPAGSKLFTKTVYDGVGRPDQTVQRLRSG